MIKKSADQEGMMILNMYIFNKIVSKYIKQKLTELQGEINKFRVSQHALGGCVKNTRQGFPGGAVVESLPANAGNTGSSPGLGRSHMPRSN